MILILSALQLACRASGVDRASTTHEVYKRADHGLAPQALVPLAEAGNVEAQMRLAGMYLQGSGTDRDVREATKWYELAAAAGDAVAIRNLGALYMIEHEVQDLKKAYHWSKIAAESGDPERMASLALLELRLHGNREACRDWQEKAAASGLEDAMVNLSRSYLTGTILAQDYSRAHYWLEQLAERGSEFGYNGLGMIYSKGIGLPADPAKANVYFQRAAWDGDATAQFNLGKSYLEGVGTAVDDDLAVYWLTRSARQGNAHGVLYLANCHSQGRGLPRSKQRAYVLYRLAGRYINSPELDNAISELRDSMTPVERDDSDRLFLEIADRWTPFEVLLPSVPEVFVDPSLPRMRP